MGKQLTTVQLAEKYGFSPRHWQRRAASGEIPNTVRVRMGKRYVYKVDKKSFDVWWAAQHEPVKPEKPCQASIISTTETGGGGSGRSTRAKGFASHSKQDILELLKNVGTG